MPKILIILFAVFPEILTILAVWAVKRQAANSIAVVCLFVWLMDLTNAQNRLNSLLIGLDCPGGGDGADACKADEIEPVVQQSAALEVD